MTKQVSNQTPQSQSRLDQEPFYSQIKDLIEQGESNASIVRILGESTEKSIRRFRKRHNIAPPSPIDSRKGSVHYHDGDEADVTTPAASGLILDDPDAMLRERGLSPQDWFLNDATINEWDGPSQDGPVTYHQAKLHIKRKHPELQILAARSDGWVAPKIKKPLSGRSQLWVVVGDQQCPFQDEELHEAFCSWLETNKPDHGISLGDLLDFPDISRHRLDPENTANVNECVQLGYDMLRDYRVASPDTDWQILPGNHSERIRNLLLDKPSVQPLYGIKRADTPEDTGEPVLTLSHLLRLDELGIEYVDPEGSYELGQIQISPKLAVRHGWLAKKGSGTSALATLEHLGYSVIVGHTHRQSLVYKTTYDIDGTPTVLTGVEAGCMCRVDQSKHDGRKYPAYTTLPNWQQGFSTVTTFPDGLFRIDNATFVNGTLLWRDARYR
jgi:hypothetical protein